MVRNFVYGFQPSGACKIKCRKKLGRISALIVALACFLPSILYAGELVTAKGMSFFEAGREAVAREKALDEAKRAAIEQTVGTVIESRTVVEDFQVIQDQIFSHAAGYLKNLTVLDEKISDLGTYEVTIQAEVETTDVINDLDRFAAILGWQKNPRIAIIIEPTVAVECQATAQKTAGLLTSKLKNEGFKVFKYTGAEEIEIGLLIGLNLEMSSKTTKFQGLELTLNEIGLNASIHRPGDNEILAAAAAVQSIPGENRLLALDKGAKAGVDAIWKDLRRELTTAWEKEVFGQRNIYLIIKNISSFFQAEKIADVLKGDVGGMMAADLISYQENTAEFDLKFRGWPNQLLNELQLSYFKNMYFDLDLEKLSGNKMILKIKGN